MKHIFLGLLPVLALIAFSGCQNPAAENPDPDLIPSSIVFSDGPTVSRQLGSGDYTNSVSGTGDGAITYTSGTTGAATVDGSTGTVQLVAEGVTLITANKEATATHSAVSASYTLTVTAKSPSTIDFADGLTVTKQFGSGSFTNTVSGDGTGDIIYESGTASVATIDPVTGEVTLTGTGETVITATKAETSTHAAAGSSYTLTVTPIPVDLTNLVQAGGVSGTSTTTSLTFTFSAEPITLTAADITVTGAVKGALTGTGTTRSLAISNIAVANGLSVSVSIDSPDNYTITGVPKTAAVYKDTWDLGGIGPAGGYVFYIKSTYSDGWRYLEASSGDQGSSTAWWSGTAINITGAKATAVGTGKANTVAIVSAQGTSTNYAARVCDQLVLGGYSDWFLPSRDELKSMYYALKSAGLVNFGFFYYWSSSQNAADTAYNENFYSGGTYSYTTSQALGIRAVRSY